MPIAPDKNRGPALLVKEMRCLASALLMSLLFRKSVVILAPTG